MRNIARLSDNDRRELFRNTADKMGLNDAIVEKDFWVCFTLDYLFGRNVPIQNRMLLTKKPMRVRRYFCPKHSARQSKPAYPRKSVVKQMST